VGDAATGQELLTLPCEGNDVKSVAFSADGRHLIAANWAGVVRPETTW